MKPVYLDVPLFTTKNTSFGGVTFLLFRVLLVAIPPLSTNILYMGVQIALGSLKLVGSAPLATIEYASLGVLMFLFSWNNN